MKGNKMEKCVCGHPKLKHRREREKKFVDPRQNSFVYCECSLCNCRKYKYDGKSKRVNTLKISIRQTTLSLKNPFSFFEPFFSSRRGTLGIIVSVLLACQTPKNMTHIMYKSNVNCSMLRVYLKKLIEIKLVKKISKPKQKSVRGRQSKGFYKLTPLGKRFLNCVYEMKSIWNEGE